FMEGICMHYLYEAGQDEDAPLFLLLHGAGGDEHDLIPFTKKFNPAASYISVRGNVREKEGYRFFEGQEDGSYSLNDILTPTEELHSFLDEAAQRYQFNRSNILAVGYSEGASMAASLLLHHAQSAKGAMLYHPLGVNRKGHAPKFVDTLIFI